MTGQGVLLLVIAVAAVAGFLVLMYRGEADDEQEARKYAEQSLHELIFAHNAAYYAANLSARARRNNTPGWQRYVIDGLTKLGVPTAPLTINGDVTYENEIGNHGPLGHFRAHGTYAILDADFTMDVARRGGVWRIDFFTATWLDKNAVLPDGAR